MVTREQILAAGKRRYTTIEVPSLGIVHLQSLSETERSSYYAARFTDKGKYLRDVWFQRSARLLSIVMVDGETKSRLFSDDDWPLLNDLAVEVTAPIYEAARLHCRVDEPADDSAAEGDEKKVDSSGGTDSPNSSPATTPVGPSGS